MTADRARELADALNEWADISDITTAFRRDITEAAALLRSMSWRPIGITAEMRLAGARSIRDTMNMPNHTERAARCYEAMQAAQPPQGDER